MATLVDADAERRLDKYIDHIGLLLGNKKQRASFAVYALGLISDGERKSIEPIAARACADPALVPAMEARLGHFLNDARWSDHRVRAFAAEYAIEEISRVAPIETWILDDTGFLKQGTHSVGVQRQYTGSAGKTANCQVAVSLSVATSHAHLPIDFELYLPESWTSNPARRAEARIPQEVVFQTKLELGLAMVRRALANGVPPGVVLVDAAYGNSNDFRMGVRALGLDYAVAIQSPTKVWRLDRLDRCRGEALSVRDLSPKLGDKKVRPCTWREGNLRDLSRRFATLRLAPAHG